MYEDVEPNNWKLSEFTLKDINLLAGISGVGKTRTLNTIINLSRYIQKKREISLGRWHILFEVDKNKHEYYLEIKLDENERPYISKEYLKINGKRIMNRDKRGFSLEGKPLPNLGDEDIGLYLLRNEDKIKKVYDGFTRIYIRRLNPNYGEVPKGDFGALPKDFLLKKQKPLTLKAINEKYEHLNVQLFLLKEFHKNVFKQIENDFKQIFPFVLSLDIKSIRDIEGMGRQRLPLDAYIPMLVIREKNVKNEIPLMNVSSGMLRALIQLMDVYTIPDNSIYLIDEVETSMGVISLPVMLDLLMNQSKRIQFIFTSHHPYIIQNLDMKYWQILTRRGNIVLVVSGETLKERFSKSFQDIYIQLINSELIEDGI